MDNDYTQITWPEVRAGDVLMHENGDRLTVERVQWEIEFPVLVHTAPSRMYADVWERAGFTPYRRKPEMPRVPGAYLDKDGYVWVHEDNGTDNTWRQDAFLYSAQDAVQWAPFTRLVPMPTEEQVHATVYNALRGSAVDGMYPLRTINAFMALLTGKEADSE